MAKFQFTMSQFLRPSKQLDFGQLIRFKRSEASNEQKDNQ